MKLFLLSQFELVYSHFYRLLHFPVAHERVPNSFNYSRGCYYLASSKLIMRHLTDDIMTIVLNSYNE
ncbi:MAG: hypothetical protein D6160_09920 [Ketobacter sp.]|nr:MAG: hypothetical protein D6160_09920 [Ketobacter sp.]